MVCNLLTMCLIYVIIHTSTGPLCGAFLFCPRPCLVLSMLLKPTRSGPVLVPFLGNASSCAWRFAMASLSVSLSSDVIRSISAYISFRRFQAKLPWLYDLQPFAFASNHFSDLFPPNPYMYSFQMRAIVVQSGTSYKHIFYACLSTQISDKISILSTRIWASCLFSNDIGGESRHFLSDFP